MLRNGFELDAVGRIDCDAWKNLDDAFRGRWEEEDMTVDALSRRYRIWSFLIWIT